MVHRARYWVITDLETTGLDPIKGHEIIQIAKVIFDAAENKIIQGSAESFYVAPDNWGKASPEALEIHGITYEMAKSGLNLFGALGWWCTDIDWEQSVLASWGNDFELKFLNAAFQKTNRVIPYPWVTIDLRTHAHALRSALGHIELSSMSYIADWLGLALDENKLHDALYDARLL